MSTPPTTGIHPRRLAFPAILFLATLLLFLPSLHFEFLNWDDTTYIHKNPWLLNLSWGNVAGVFGHSYFSNYHPLTMLDLLVDFQLFGYEPEGYRLMNILLHALTVVAGFFLLRAMGGSRWVSFFFMLYFAVHPLRIESVVWISERKDVLCAFFYTVSLLAWSKGGRWLALSLAAMVMALGAKAMAVSLPLVFLLHDGLFARERMRGRVPVYAFALLIGGLVAWLNRVAQVEAVSESTPMVEGLKIAAWAPVHYMMNTLAPVGLTALYPMEFRPTRHSAAALAGIVACVCGVWAVLGCWRRCPQVSFGLAGAALALGPVSGIVVFGSAYAADRYSYLPTLVLFAGLAPALDGLLASRSCELRRGLAAGAAIACIAMGVLTVRHLPTWRTSESVWRRVLEVYPESRKARLNLTHAEVTGKPSRAATDLASKLTETFEGSHRAAELAVSQALKAGNRDEAMRLSGLIDSPSLSLYWKLRIYRDTGGGVGARGDARALLALDPPAIPEHRAEAAMALVQAGEDAEARAALERIDEPTFMGAFAWGLLSKRAKEHGDMDAAESCGRRALSIFPAEAQAVEVISSNLMEGKKLSEADRVLRRAARHPAARATTRAYALAWRARIAELNGASGGKAATMYEKAFAFLPDESLTVRERAETANYSGWVAESVGQMGHAERLYAAARAADPTFSDAIHNLAYVKLLLGKRDAAIELLEGALRDNPGDEVARQNLERLRAEGPGRQ